MTTAVTTLTDLIETQQDFEWYPTTDEMIGAVVKDLKDYFGRDEDKRPSIGSVLDIGAGDGRVLKALSEACDCSGLYAIEKAAPLIDRMPANIAIVGTEFEGQTLIDKDVDVIFCNPPYSHFEDWAVKILKEGFCKRMYLILPRRWASSERIKAALEARESEAKTIWTGGFHHAERQARAVVDIICISLMQKEEDYGRDKKKDPFDTWFHEIFPEIEALNHFERLENTEKMDDKPRINTDLLKGHNLVDRLADLYKEEMKSMLASYQALCSIDPVLLATVGVKAPEVKEGLRKKISGLKNKYWQELFDHLDKITERLASNSRAAIVEKMGSAVHVDFTADNAYAVVIWVLKNANEYIDSQVLVLFKEMSRPENVSNYKSNQKTWDAEQWRYLRSPNYYIEHEKEIPSRYMLEYRIIIQKYNAISGGGHSYSWDYQNGLHKDCHALLGDICTIANNLGFVCQYTQYRRWTSGSPQEVYLENGEILMRVRAFMNGNLHIQFNQDFIKALNIEASRLLGWIKSPKEACDEIGVNLVTAQRYWSVNRIFAPSEFKLLTAGNEVTP